MNRRLAYGLIVAAAFLWGIIGLFITLLHDAGFSSLQIVSVRALTASFFLLLYISIKNRASLSIRLRDSRYFIGTGMVSIALFNWCMFTAIQETSIAVATILLYTAPVFVTLLSRIFFREAFTPRKIAALFITLLGCTLVAGVVREGTEALSSYGLMLGLASGFFYALYSIFGKAALQKYDSLTVTLYTFLFAAMAVTPFSNLGEVLPLIVQPQVLLWAIGLGLLSTTLPYLLYTKSLSLIESSRASIIATLEPVIAALLSVLVFQEQLSVWQYLGIILVIGAVVLVQERVRRKVHSGLKSGAN